MIRPLLITLPLLLSLQPAVASEKYVGANPHMIATPEWQRYMQCEVAADFSATFANDVVMHEAAGIEAKRQRGLAVRGMKSTIDLQTVESLTTKKSLEAAIANEKNPDKAFQLTWEYCMSFSLKQHYYFDAELPDIPGMENP